MNDILSPEKKRAKFVGALKWNQYKQQMSKLSQ